MDIAELHRRCVEQFVGRVRSVGGAQWTAPTPCEGWDVRTLVNHIVNEQRWTVPLMGGATLDEVGDRFGGDLLGDDPVGVVEAAGPAAAAAADDGIAAKRTVHLSFGDVPAAESLDSASSLEEFGAGLDEAGSAIDEIDNELGTVCG